MGREEQGVCMLFQVEKLDSGVVQRTKQACGKMSGGFPPRERKEDGPRSLELMATMIILRAEGHLRLHSTVKQERSHSRPVLVKPHPKR